MTYSDDEIALSVERLVQGNVEFSRRGAGDRMTDEAYVQLLELVGTGLFYEQDAVFDLIDRATHAAARKVKLFLVDVEEAISNLSCLLARNKVTNASTPLELATRSLEQIRSSLGTRAEIDARAHYRFDKALSWAIDEVGKQVVQAGIGVTPDLVSRRIIRSRKEAQEKLGAWVTQLESKHAEILADLTQLLGALEEYEVAARISTVSGNQLARVQEELESALETARAKEKDGKSQALNTSAFRDTFLSLISSRTTVSQLAGRRSSLDARLLADAAYRLSCSGSVTPPSILGSISAPWPLEQGVNDQLYLAIDGVNTTIDLLPISESAEGIVAAEVRGTGAGPFRIVETSVDPYPICTRKITSGSNYSTNGKTLFFVVDGTSYEVAFGSDLSASGLASAIGLAISAVAATVGSGGGEEWVVLAYASSTPPTRYGSRYMEACSGVDYAADLEPWWVMAPVGDTTADSTFGADKTNELQFYVDDFSAEETVTLTAGLWPTYARTATQVAADITAAGVGLGGRYEGDVDEERVVIRSGTKGEGSRIEMTSQGLSGSIPTDSQRTLLELGFSQHTVSYGKDVSAGHIVLRLNSTAAFSQVARATTVRLPLLESSRGVYSGVSAVEIPLEEDPTADWDSSLVIKMAIHGGPNAGIYSVTGWSFGGSALIVDVDRTLRSDDTSQRFTLSIFIDRLSISSKSSSVDATLEIKTGANSAHTTLGLATGVIRGGVSEILIEKKKADNTWSPVNLRSLSVRIGDVINNISGAYLSTVTGTINAVDGILEVEPVLSSTSLTSGFQIKSGAALSYSEFIESLLALRVDRRVHLGPDGINSLLRILRAIIRLQQPSFTQVAAAVTALSDYQTTLNALILVYLAYQVTPLEAVTKTYGVLMEHGQNRARDLLLSAHFADFFETTVRTASYSQDFIARTTEFITRHANEISFTRNEHQASSDRFVFAVEDDYDPSWDLEDEPNPPMSPIEPLDFGLEE